MAISMMGGLTLWGIIALEAFHVTNWLPLPFEESEWFSKTMAVISILIIVGGIFTLGYMAKYRAEALSKPVELSELVDKQRIDTSSSVQNVGDETKTTVALLFTFISVVSLSTAIAGLACLPAVVTAVIVAANGLTCCPLLGIIHFAANLLEHLCDTFFNIFLRLQDIADGIFAPLTLFLHRKLRINDNTAIGDQLTHAQQTGQGNG